MSALAERQINEAIELAGTLARLSTEERSKLGPRTPGSFSDGCSSPGGHFFFSLRKNRSSKEAEKKSFVDGLNSAAVDPDRGVMTPGALEAYDALVARTPGGETQVEEDKAELNRRSWESSGGESSSSGERRLPPLPSHLALNGTRAPTREEVSRKHSEPHISTRTSLDIAIGYDGHPLARSLSADHSDEEIHRTKPHVPLISHMDGIDGLTPPAYPAPSAPVARRPEHSSANLKPEVTLRTPEHTINGSPPLLPEKKSRKDSVVSLPSSDSPPLYRAPSPPPAPAPPALPPRIRLRPSTINCKPHQRRFPLASETLPRSLSEATTQPDAFDFNCGSHHQPKTMPRQTSEANRSGNSDHRKSRPNRPSHSVESRSSCESDIGNLTHESEDSVFSDSAAPPARAKPQASGRSASLAGAGSGRPLKLNIRNVKLNAAELGIYDKADLFWVKSVNFDLPEKSQSESDLLLQDVSAPIPGRYETSDSVSYEDLMEFALDGPVRAPRSGTCKSHVSLFSLFSVCYCGILTSLYNWLVSQIGHFIANPIRSLISHAIIQLFYSVVMV